MSLSKPSLIGKVSPAGLPPSALNRCALGALLPWLLACLLTQLSPSAFSAKDAYGNPGQEIVENSGSAQAWESEWEEEWAEEWAEPQLYQFSGFLELLGGLRYQDNPVISEDLTLGDARARLELSRYFSLGTKPDSLLANDIYASGKIDLYYDAVLNDYISDPRELLFLVPIGEQVEIKLGRQTLTWGTGDFVFLNDLFSKNWVAFFSGLEDEYLKQPGDALRINYFSKPINLDLVWIPFFEQDRFLNGERFSFFSPQQNREVAAPPSLKALAVEESLDQGELALRLHKQTAGKEWALYAYRGFFGRPLGFDPVRQQPFFPRLNAYGASLRSGFMGGITNLEIAYYDSVEDASGTDPWIPNNQWRGLMGLERELISRLTLGLQYYLEWTQQYKALVDNSFNPDIEQEQYRHLITARLTYRLWQDNLILSNFMFYSPSEEDIYLRPQASYRLDDSWRLKLGANILYGRHPQTFFGQLENNSNIYLSLRCSF